MLNPNYSCSTLQCSLCRQAANVCEWTVWNSTTGQHKSPFQQCDSAPEPPWLCLVEIIILIVVKSHSIMRPQADLNPHWVVNKLVHSQWRSDSDAPSIFQSIGTGCGSAQDFKRYNFLWEQNRQSRFRLAGVEVILTQRRSQYSTTLAEIILWTFSPPGSARLAELCTDGRAQNYQQNREC